MELDHSFSVPVGVDHAWQVLLDIERIAPCMPGAAVDSIDGDDFTGTVKVKLGPINLTYKGKARFVEKDEAAYRAVIDAHGKDARGNGTAAATVTATLQPDGDDATNVAVHTALNITGKPAQFGRGVMVDVGNKLLGQFAACLATQLGDGGTPAEPEQAPEPGAAAAPEAPQEALAEPTATDVVTGAAAAPGGSGGIAATTGPALSEPVAGSAGEPVEEPVSETGGEPAGRHAAGPGAAPTPTVAPKPSLPRPEPEPINLLHSAGPAVAKRVAPVVGALALAGLVVALSRKRRRAG